MLSWYWSLLSAPGLASLPVCSGGGDGGESKVGVWLEGGWRESQISYMCTPARFKGRQDGAVVEPAEAAFKQVP